MCVYYKGNVVLLVYVDDGIFLAPNQDLIDTEIALILKDFIDPKTGKLYRGLNITDEGDLSDYLGVKIERLPNGTIKLSQPHLIQQIMTTLGSTRAQKSSTRQLPLQ
jgi:hypothetical protein